MAEHYKDSDVSMFDVADLACHPLNIKLYAEHVDDDFKESIKKSGVLVPLVVCRVDDKLTIVSGRRRWMCAKMLGIKEVPARFWECSDPLDLQERIIMDNIRNVTTASERAREFAELLRIEKERASQRIAAGSASQSEGKAVDIAASKVGITPYRAKKDLAVVQAADEIAESGDVEKAAEIIDTLDKKGSVAAAKVIESAKPKTAAPVPPAPKPAYPESELIDKCIGIMKQAIDKSAKQRDELVNAFDRKKNEQQAFANRFKKFERLGQEVADEIDVVANKISIIQEAWNSYVKLEESE